MSGLRRAIRHPDRGQDPHVRARALASDRLLETLAADDERWLEAHLGRCAGCDEYAAAIAADRALFGALREASTAPPRDLGARVAGALDTEVRDALRTGRRVPGRRLAKVGTVSAGEDSSGVRGRAEGSIGAPTPVAARRIGGPRQPRQPRPSFAIVGVAAAAIIALLFLPVITGPALVLPDGASSTASLAAGPGPTPMHVAAGPVAWVQRDTDGRYVLNSSPVEAVCPGVDPSACGRLDGTSRAIVTLEVGEPSSVVIGKRGDVAVVVSRDTVYAVNMPAVAASTPAPTPVPSPKPTASLPAATPTRTGVPATPPVDTPVPSGSPVTVSTPAPPSPRSTVGVVVMGSSNPGSSASPTASASPVPTASPSSSPTPPGTPASSGEPPGTPAPSGVPSGTPVPSAVPSATPEVTPDGTPAPTATAPGGAASASSPPTPEPTPGVTIAPETPAPTAARTLAIASGVVVVGAAASYSSDGRWVAFSARPSDGSRGPDVYAWRVGAQHAVAVTNDGVSQYSDWYGDQILVSKTLANGEPATSEADPASVTARSYLVDAATGDVVALGGAAWRPVVDPTQRRVAFWRGSFAWSDEQRTWMPASGRLVIGDWQSLRDGSDGGVDTVPWSSSIADGAAWDVGWDPSGRRLAVWISDGAGDPTGRLSLFIVQPDGSLGTAVVKEAPALGAFSLDAERLAWATPPGANGAGSSISVYAWNENGAGHMVSNPDPGGSILVAP